MSLDISVVIPTYNAALSITKTLQSLVDQTLENFEVILVDDGSTDELKKYLESFYDKINLNYYYQENGGVSSARNKGISHARGKYICFLDSDDFYDEDYLMKMVNKSESEKSDICYCGFKTIENGVTEITKSEFTKEDVLKKYMLGRVVVNTTGWVVNREFLLSTGVLFTVGLSWAEDMQFFGTLLTKTKKIAYVKEYLSNYNNDVEGERLTDYSIGRMDLDHKVFTKIYDELENKDTELRKAIIDYRLSASLTDGLINALRNEVNRDEILKYYDKYKEYVTGFTYNNGLKSMKLNIKKVLLGNKIKKIQKSK